MNSIPLCTITYLFSRRTIILHTKLDSCIPHLKVEVLVVSLVDKVRMHVDNIIQFSEMECESTQELIHRILLHGMIIEDIKYIPTEIWIKKPEMKKWARL